MANALYGSWDASPGPPRPIGNYFKPIHSRRRPRLRHRSLYTSIGASPIAGTPTGTPRWRASRRAKRKARIVYNDCAFPAKEGGKAAFLAGH